MLATDHEVDNSCERRVSGTIESPGSKIRSDGGPNDQDSLAHATLSKHRVDLFTTMRKYRPRVDKVGKSAGVQDSSTRIEGAIFSAIAEFLGVDGSSDNE